MSYREIKRIFIKNYPVFKRILFDNTDFSMKFLRLFKNYDDKTGTDGRF
jgi:hypothetical protein